VERGCAREQLGHLARKIGDVRAALVPERRANGHLAEGEHLLHAAIAVRRHDKGASVAAVPEAQNGVVVELPLLPVIEQREVAATNA
jgi:hypothetical protein